MAFHLFTGLTFFLLLTLGACARALEAGTCERAQRSDVLVARDGAISVPGRIEVEDVDPADQKVESALEQLLISYGLSCGLSWKTYDRSGALIARTTSCRVPPGHECEWIAILGRSPRYVRHVRLQPFKMVSVPSETRRIDPYWGPAPAGRMRGLSPPDLLLKDTNAFLAHRYRHKGEVRTTRASQHFRLFQVRKLRGEVLSGFSYWEQLELHTVVSEGNIIHLIVDGYYSSGVGENAPADEAYEHMDRKYYKQLSDYVGHLTRDLEQFFLSLRR